MLEERVTEYQVIYPPEDGEPGGGGVGVLVPVTHSAQYVWSPVYVDALIERSRDTDADGVLDERLWVQQDANWNVTSVVDGSGAVAERYTYDPYGAVTAYEPDYSAVRAASGYGWTVRFQGMTWDSATGLYGSSRERGSGYSPTLGRWVSPDPLGLGPDTNWYRFVGNGPGNWTDPSGLQGEKVVVILASEPKRINKDDVDEWTALAKEKWGKDTIVETGVKSPKDLYDRIKKLDKNSIGLLVTGGHGTFYPPAYMNWVDKAKYVATRRCEAGIRTDGGDLSVISFSKDKDTVGKIKEKLTDKVKIRLEGCNTGLDTNELIYLARMFNATVSGSLDSIDEWEDPKVKWKTVDPSTKPLPPPVPHNQTRP